MIHLKRNDTGDTIRYIATQPNGDIVNLTGATARFLMGNKKSLITNAVANIVDPAQGIIEYTLTENDTILAGDFPAEFEVTFADGDVTTFPRKNYILVSIESNIDKNKTEEIVLRVSLVEQFKAETTAQVNNIQAQVNQLVVEGDSSVEAAQARVEADGTVNATLKARLDKKEAEFTSQLAQTEQKIKDISVNVKDFGAKGDWNGTGGRDNLTAFNNAVNALPSSGGTVYIPDGDYLLSNTWYIDKGNIHVILSPGATVRTVSETTNGATIAFIGYGEGLGVAVTPQRYFCKIEGGKVTNSGSNGLDNALGFVRYQNVIVKNVNISSCDRKAITCQYGVDNVFIEENIIDLATDSAITIETECKNIFIFKNIIDNCKYKSIELFKVSNSDLENVYITENVITNSTSDGIFVKNTNNPKIFGNTIKNASAHGINLNTVNNAMVKHNTILNSVSNAVNCASVTSKLDITDNHIVDCGVGINTHTVESMTIQNNYIKNAKKQGIYSHLTTGEMDILINQIINASYGNSNVSDAILLSRCTISPKLTSNTVKGTTHKTVLNQSEMSTNQAVCSGNVFQSGVAGVYSGWSSQVVNDIVDGKQYIIQNGNRIMFGTSAPTAGTYKVGDKVLNTTPTAGGYEGWVCVTSGTSGIWKGYGLIQV